MGIMGIMGGDPAWKTASDSLSLGWVSLSQASDRIAGFLDCSEALRYVFFSLAFHRNSLDGHLFFLFSTRRMDQGGISHFAFRKGTPSRNDNYYY